MPLALEYSGQETASMFLPLGSSLRSFVPLWAQFIHPDTDRRILDLSEL